MQNAAHAKGVSMRQFLCVLTLKNGSHGDYATPLLHADRFIFLLYSLLFFSSPEQRVGVRQKSLSGRVDRKSSRSAKQTGSVR